MDKLLLGVAREIITPEVAVSFTATVPMFFQPRLRMTLQQRHFTSSRVRPRL